MLNAKKIPDEFMIVQNTMHDNAHIRTQKQFSDQVDKLSKNKKDDEVEYDRANRMIAHYGCTEWFLHYITYNLFYPTFGLQQIEQYINTLNWIAKRVSHLKSFCGKEIGYQNHNTLNPQLHSTTKKLTM